MSDLTDDQRAVLGLLEWADNNTSDEVSAYFLIRRVRPNGVLTRVVLGLRLNRGQPLECEATDGDIMRASEIALRRLEDAIVERAST